MNRDLTSLPINILHLKKGNFTSTKAHVYMDQFFVTRGRHGLNRCLTNRFINPGANDKLAHEPARVEVAFRLPESPAIRCLP